MQDRGQPNRTTRLHRVLPRVRPLLRRGYPGKWLTRSNRMRQDGFRLGGAASPRTSRPGSSTSPTLHPIGSPDRFSPSTVALNSPDPPRIVDLRVQLLIRDQAGFELTSAMPPMGTLGGDPQRHPCTGASAPSTTLTLTWSSRDGVCDPLTSHDSGVSGAELVAPVVGGSPH